MIYSITHSITEHRALFSLPLLCQRFKLRSLQEISTESFAPRRVYLSLNGKERRARMVAHVRARRGMKKIRLEVQRFTHARYIAHGMKRIQRVRERRLDLNSNAPGDQSRKPGPVNCI